MAKGKPKTRTYHVEHEKVSSRNSPANNDHIAKIHILDDQLLLVFNVCVHTYTTKWMN